MKIRVAIWMVLGLIVSACEAAEFKPNEEGFIRNWVLLEPIQLSEKAGSHDEENQKDFFEKEYIPNLKELKPKEGDKAKVNNAELTWRAAQAEEWFLALPETTNAMSIAVAYIECEEEMTGVMLKIGSDDSSMWTLNGKEVLRIYSGRGVDKDQNTSPVLTLKKGTNVLMAQVINGEGQSSLCARFSKAVTNFKVLTESK